MISNELELLKQNVYDLLHNTRIGKKSSFYLFL